MITPTEISQLLMACPICYDIQNKIFGMAICTPTVNIINTVIANMNRYKRRNQLAYNEPTLTSYCTTLSLFNFLVGYYDLYNDGNYSIMDEEVDEELPELPEFLHEFIIAYGLYHFDGQDEVEDSMNSLKQLTKIRLNKMIEEGP